MVTAIDSNTGSEYEIKEEFEPGSDKPYARMCVIANSIGLLNDDMMIYRLTKAEKEGMVQYLTMKTDAAPYQVLKFLHL